MKMIWNDIKYQINDDTIWHFRITLDDPGEKSSVIINNNKKNILYSFSLGNNGHKQIEKQSLLFEACS